MHRDSTIDPETQHLIRVGRFQEALLQLERATASATVCGPSHALLASTLLRLDRTSDALEVVNSAANLRAGSADGYDGLAYVATELQQHQLARALYRRATEEDPRTARRWHNLANSERSFGRLAEAEAACDRALAADARHYPSFLLRSELRIQTKEANHIEDLRTRLADRQLDVHGKVFMGYALGKELDDVQAYDAAFSGFSGAATRRRSMLSYDVHADERMLARIARTYATATPAEATENPGAPLIFIVGLPRSGTTLVERILTGLDAVHSNGETENFARALTACSPSAPGDVLERSAAADSACVGRYYELWARRIGGSHAIIEKLPTNYLYLGAILRALPRAKILLLKRSPLDSCFAMFRTLFGNAYPFSYSFEELARYYAAYERLTAHWQSLFGARIHEVSYEDLVSRPLVVGATLATYCGLSWRPGAIDIQTNKAVSLTASASQVRQPIYGTSSGRWRHYQAHLQPLIKALRHRGVTLPDDA